MSTTLRSLHALRVARRSSTFTASTKESPHKQRRRLATFTGIGTTSIVVAAFGGSLYCREYRAQRDESAVSLPRDYDWNAIQAYWKSRPVTVLARFGTVAYHLGPLVGAYVRDVYVLDGILDQRADDQERGLQHQNKQLELAIRLREALMYLGPAFVKAGQQLSIRPDLVPPCVLHELQKLCDAVRPVPDEVCMRVIQRELNMPNVHDVFDDVHLVAAASLGQVYKAIVRETGETVAIKVQRPDMQRSFSLDLYILQRIGTMIDVFTSAFTNQPPFHGALYETFARGSYEELDYEKEAANQLHFKRELAARKCPVVVPDVYSEWTTAKVLTSEWIEGVKLADSPREQIQKLIPVGVELFLTQLLDIGAFHADPHPGNLLVTERGQLCLIDFGLTAEVDLKSRNAMTKAIVHLLTRDFQSLVAEDAKELGFLPEDFDTTELTPLLVKILTAGILEGGGSDLRKRKKKFMEISSELNQVFFRYPFSVPPFFALVTRGLGLLEGIALTGDPDFDIFRASVPYARRRAVRLLGQRPTLRRMAAQQQQHAMSKYF